MTRRARLPRTGSPLERVELPDGRAYEIGGKGYEGDGHVTRNGQRVAGAEAEQVRMLAMTGALCNEGRLEVVGDDVRGQGDPVDLAFLVFASRLNVSRPALLDTHPEVHFIPFESQRRFAASFNRHGDDIRVHVKGAAGALLPMCEGIDAATVHGQEERLAAAGYRVLATATGMVRERAGVEALRGLHFLGLVGLIDPIRPEVPDAIARCHSAGIDVRIITGDHPATGMAIARAIGSAGEDSQALSGRDIRALEGDEAALRARGLAAHVFARIEPAQKTTIVAALAEAGHFVAVTGDGVNDAPALRRAHIGVAMGRGGTDVARGAADLILTDDNFASIVNGIEEGRVAYDNVRKVTWLLLATGTAEVLLFFLAIFTGLPLPLDAVQLLWLNLVTNGVQDVALAFEQGEPGVLERKPRPPDQPIIDRQMLEQTALSGGYIGIVAFGAFYYLLEHLGMGEFEARNHLLLLMVLFENAHCFSCRSETRSLFDIPVRANRLLVGSVVAAQGLHIAAMFMPGLRTVLEIEPVALTAWLGLVPIALSLVVVDELGKYLRRRWLTS